MSLPPQTPLGNDVRSSSSSINSNFGGGGVSTNQRSMQTPLKTPLKTPLRTPGGVGEQLSHTPVINFAAIEAHKENVQPLVQGRSAHALNNALSQRQAELQKQRKQFEELVKSEENEESDDPLDVWQKYVKWCIDNYPSGQSSESDLLVILERCTRLFKQSTQYRNDVRYLRMWILYARNVDCPSDVYNYLLANEIGTSLASLYEELALVYEGQESYEKSDETYRMGIHRSAQPIDRLKKRYAEYQNRILSKEGKGENQRITYKDALRSAMNKAQRSMLGTKSGSTSMSANSIRGIGGDASLPSKSSALSSGNNSRKLPVFKDADGEDIFSKRSKGGVEGTANWTDIGTIMSRKQEKAGTDAKAWKGEILPQRERVTTPKRPAIAIYRDSDDEDEEGRTPGKIKGGDVFSKNREASESDKLRKNPFANYAIAELKPQINSTQSQSNREDKVKPNQKGEEKAKKKVVGSSSTSKSSSSKASSNSKQERYAVPLAELYPGLDIDQAVKRTSRKHKSGEMCLEELTAKRMKLDQMDDTIDPWAFLDALQGQWLPELKIPQRKHPIKRDPTVTAFTRAAQDEVLQMFNNGMVDSDEDESSEDEQSESEEEEEDNNQIAQSSALKPNLIQMKENEVDPFTPTPAPKSFSVAPQKRTLLREVPMLDTDKQSGLPNIQAKAILATPARKVFGGDRKPLAVATQSESQIEQILPQKPQRITNEVFIEEEDEDSVQEEDEKEGRNVNGEEEDGMDYLNRPMRELAPLSPITEATEYTRYTQSTRTSRTSTSNGRRSEAWTPFASREQGSYDHYENADESHFGNRLHGQEEAVESSLHVLQQQDEAPINNQPDNDNAGPLCPFETEIIDAIIKRLPLSLESSDDFINLSNENADQLKSLQKRAAQLTKRRSSSHTSPLINTKDGTAEWTMQIAENTFIIRQKLGEGGYGAVFLAEDQAGITGRQRILGGINGDASFAVLDDDEYINDREDDGYDETEPKLIAIKVESPPNRWEFYILGQLRARLLDEKRLSSIICARKFFCFQDESFLMLEYAEKGTLLEIVNSAVKAGVASSSAIMTTGSSDGSNASVGIDEVLVMFFIIEVIKCVEALHAVDLLHGDLKIDNCLLRLNESQESWTHSYKRTGENGWSSKGITLIDFGKAIDLRQFSFGQQFVANWTPEKHDMPQIHKGQSWRFEIDYYGIASIAYCLLFGKYIEVIDQGENQYTIDKPLRRYWQTEIWTSLFQFCLNSTHHNDPASQLANIRDKMETWLEENCFRAGKNLKGSLKKLEIWSMKRSM